jgi:hypothetical protein
MSVDLQQLLAAYHHHIKPGGDPEALCELGPLLRGAGREQEAKRCFRGAVDFILKAARAGDADAALHIEQGVYLNFVRAVETEEHYYRCFAAWREELARLGRRFRDSRGWDDARAERIGFVLINGFRLAHSQVLLRTLSSYLQVENRACEPVIYVVDECAPEFAADCRARGVSLVSLLEERPALSHAGLAEKLVALRDRMRADSMGCAVWVSMPAGATFALSMGLAPVQIFWALRFHPVTGPFIDGFLTYGAPGEKERLFGKQAWQVVPTPLAIEPPTAPAEQVAAERARFPERFLFGTVAREDKIRSPDFLRAVAAILKAVPEAGYVWTGRERDPQIDNHFIAEGVASRCHFAGWVDSSLYANVFDAFLETFPLGCGVTGYQAMGAGTPLLSFLTENTVFGMQYWDQVAPDGSGSVPDLAGYPVLCARTVDEYVALATRLSSDASFLAQAGRRAKQFFEHEVTLGLTQARQFFGAVEQVVARKLAHIA